MEIKVGDKYSVQITPEQVLNVEILKLSAREVEFMATGDGVNDPDEPRQMPLGSFAKWLKAMPKAI